MSDSIWHKEFNEYIGLYIPLGCITVKGWL